MQNKFKFGDHVICNCDFGDGISHFFKKGDLLTVSKLDSCGGAQHIGFDGVCNLYNADLFSSINADLFNSLNVGFDSDNGAAEQLKTDWNGGSTPPVKVIQNHDLNTKAIGKVKGVGLCGRLISIELIPNPTEEKPKPHKCADLIKSWANGAVIEMRLPGRNGDSWIEVKTPDWSAGEYRIKSRKHQHLIEAHKNGAEIEWFSCSAEAEWLICPSPGWFDDIQYRIKPEIDQAEIDRLEGLVSQDESIIANRNREIEVIKRSIARLNSNNLMMEHRINDMNKKINLLKQGQ